MKGIGYTRVSTKDQGVSGLGLEAQYKDIGDYTRQNGIELIRTFVEVESGGVDDRPELQKAMKLCKIYGATLIVAKLDRLSRDVHFLSGLMKEGIKFVCCDNPHANELTIHILAAMAEYERKMIKARVKAAIQASKARGVVWGGNHGRFFTPEIRKASARKVTELANKRANNMKVIFDHLRSEGVNTAKGIATKLNEMNVPTARGGKWFTSTVIGYLDRVYPERQWMVW